jgi:hypothetical protein
MLTMNDPHTPLKTPPRGDSSSERTIIALTNMNPIGLKRGDNIELRSELTERDVQTMDKDLRQMKEGWHILKTIYVFFRNLFSSGEKTIVKKEITKEWHAKNKRRMAHDLKAMADLTILANFKAEHLTAYTKILRMIDGQLGNTNYAAQYRNNVNTTIHEIIDNTASRDETEAESGDSQRDTFLENVCAIYEETSPNSDEIDADKDNLLRVRDFRKAHLNTHIPMGDLLALADRGECAFGIIAEAEEKDSKLFETPGVMALVACSDTLQSGDGQ